MQKNRGGFPPPRHHHLHPHPHPHRMLVLPSIFSWFFWHSVFFFVSSVRVYGQLLSAQRSAAWKMRHGRGTDRWIFYMSAFWKSFASPTFRHGHILYSHSGFWVLGCRVLELSSSWVLEFWVPGLCPFSIHRLKSEGSLEFAGCKIRLIPVSALLIWIVTEEDIYTGRL